MRWHQSQMLLQHILAGIFFFFSIFYFKYTYIFFLFSFPFSQGFTEKRVITLLHISWKWESQDVIKMKN